MYAHVNIIRQIPTGSDGDVGGWGEHALHAASEPPFFSTLASIAQNLKLQSYQGIPGLTYRSSSPPLQVGGYHVHFLRQLIMFHGSETNES